jgi:ATP-dependent DNA helicase RecG
MLVQLNTAIKTGENYYVEFKENIISNNDFAKEAVAFANAEGGLIYFGVTDDGEIVGIQEDKEFEEKIMNILRNNCVPPLNGKATWIDNNFKKILQIEIAKGPHKPYSTKDGEFYIRVGSTKRRASKEELARLLQSSGFFQYDNTVIEHASIDDLEKGKISDYFKKIYKIDIYDKNEVADYLVLLKNSKILAVVNDTYCPTVSGMLIFGKYPQEFLFQSGVLFARVDGVNIFDDILDSKQLEGRLPEIIEQILMLIKIHNKKSAEFIDGKRIDKDEYVEKVIRELVVNAVCHRNYSISGSRIRIFVLNDRIEIRSPGKLPNTMTIENVKTGATFIRNQLLFKFLNHYGFIENLGRGIPLCIKEAFSHSAKMPEFVEEGEEFVVRVYKKD